jgi:hypothetical protein
MTQRLNLSSGISIPTLDLPEAPTMPVPTLEIPIPQIPSYTPLVAPPSTLRAPPGVKGGVNSQEKAPPPSKPPTPPLPQKPALPGMREVEIPFTEVEVPLPAPDVLITAGTTATVSVAATLTATAMFKRLVSLFKPIIKQLWNRLAKKKQSSDFSYLSGRLEYLRRHTQD